MRLSSGKVPNGGRGCRFLLSDSDHLNLEKVLGEGFSRAGIRDDAAALHMKLLNVFCGFLPE